MAGENTPDLSLVPEPLWREAERRAAVIRPLAALPTCSRSEASAAAKALGVSERQVYRLLRRCREGGGVLTALVTTGSGGGRGRARIEARRNELVRDVVAELYLTPQRLSAERIVEEVRRRARAHHLRPPSASTVRRRIAALSLEERCRRGDVAIPEPVLGTTITAKAPLDMVQIDHTPVDLILVDPIERRPIGRPWITVAIDVFSRCIAGLHVTLEAPSATSVGLCLAHIAADKWPWLQEIGVDADWPVMGRPRRIGVDNAKEFHSEALERGCAQHDIAIDWRPLGRPQVIAEKFRRLHPPAPSACGQREVVPVVIMQMPTEPSVRRFYASVLIALNAPLSFNGPGERLERHALNLLRAVETRMLMVDELHNLLAGAHRRRAEFLNMLRFLGNTLRIPVIGLGTKQAQIAVRSDDQLENRFEPVPLPVWEDDLAFARLLASFEHALPLRERSDLAGKPELRSLVLQRSTGLIGEVAALLTAATNHALLHGRERIDRMVLDACDYRGPDERRAIFEASFPRVR